MAQSIKQHKILVATDAVVFGYQNGQIYVLLIQRKIEPFKNSWALPGGFILDNESAEEAITRELKEETGLKTTYLEQLKTYSTPQRDPRGHVISIAYVGLVNPSNIKLEAGTDASDAQWFNLNELPKLSFDHDTIVTDAFQRLKGKITYAPIGFDLLPDKFLFSEVEQLYSTILEYSIDRRNFRKKILSFGLIEQLDEKISIGQGRPANLFKFNRKAYNKFEKNGFTFEIKKGI